MLGLVRLLARPELLDGLRNRRQLVIRGLTPLALLAAVVAFTVLAGGREADAGERYRVAIEGPVEEIPGLLSALTSFDGGRLEIDQVDHAALAVSIDHDAGLVVGAADPPEVTLVSDVPSTRSRAAASLLRALLYEDAPFGPDSRLAVAIVDAGTAPAGPGTDGDMRAMIGRAAAGLILIQGSVLVGAAAARVHARRATGALVSHLLLPARRLHIVLGQATAELALSLLAGAPLLGLLALVVSLGLMASGAAAAVPLGLLTLLAGTVAVSLPLVVVGLAVGLWARSSQQVAALTAGSFVMVAILVRPVVVAAGDAPTALAAVPLLGPAVVVRETIGGDVSAAAVLLAVAGTTIATAALVRLAVRFLGREQIALRSP